MAAAVPTEAYEIPGRRVTVEAGEDLSAHQFQAVVLNTDDRAMKVTAQGTAIYGILQNKGNRVGDALTVMRDGISKAVAAGAIDQGASVTVSANGRFETAAAGDLVIGTARTATTAADQLFALDFDAANALVQS